MFATDGGGWEQLLIQAEAVAATYVFVGVGTFLILGVISAAVGLRVDEDSEEGGLDLALHSEAAYTSSPGTPLGAPSPRSAAKPNSSGVSSSPSHKITARSRQFASSLTFPGQS